MPAPIVNLLRLVVTGVLVIVVDPVLATGAGHEAWGLFVFAFGAGLLGLLAGLLTKSLASEPVDVAAPPAAARLTEGLRPRRWLAAVVLVLLMAAGGGAAAVIRHHYPLGPVTDTDRLPLASFPRRIGDYRQILLLLYSKRIDPFMDGSFPFAFGERLRALWRSWQDPVQTFDCRFIVSAETVVYDSVSRARRRAVDFFVMALRHLTPSGLVMHEERVDTSRREQHR